MQWQPTASLETLRARARVLAEIRVFFAERNVLEVTTPALSPAGATDPNIASFVTRPAATPDSRLYLHTSPEFAMKRLLAAGSGPIYQLCTVFRDSDSGRHHRPEFCMLEWYRPGFDYRRLMDEVELLVKTLAAPYRTIDSVRRLSYRRLFIDSLQLDPAAATIGDCRACCGRYGLPVPENMPESLDPWLDLLISSLVAPRLPPSALTFIYDYPASQAALASTKMVDDYAVAERFELYWGAVELANGFQELTDPEEQLLRFKSDNIQRSAQGIPEVAIDMALIDALRAGLPDCAGVALGVDRLLMAILEAGHINEVIAFADDP
ncbi:MAG TPA: EF-P lysine aminoacylase EpmA [Gammaproteobacteria bacterium]